MCGRYSLATGISQLQARLPVAELASEGPRYNIAPGSDVIAVTTDREGAPRAKRLHWGLVPGWAQDRRVAFRMINARAETIEERPAYKAAFERFRCLIPADGFYEWQPRAGQPKQPFHITRSDDQPFTFAGLWSVWHRGQEDELRSCTIITTVANDRLATVHTRMPVILQPGAEPEWLDAGTPAQALRGLLEGLPSGRMQLRPVGTAVNDANFDGPECLADAPPDREPTQGTLFA